MWETYQLVRANRGAAGVDDETIAMFEQNLSGNLYKLWNRMASGSYFPPPVKQVEIPKANVPRHEGQDSSRDASQKQHIAKKGYSNNHRRTDMPISSVSSSSNISTDLTATSTDEESPTNPNSASTLCASGQLAGLKTRAHNNIGANAHRDLSSSQGTSAMEKVRSAVPDQKTLLAKYGTVGQKKARTADEMDSADAAAVEEAIARSLQEKAFRILVKPEPQAIQSNTTHTSNPTNNAVVNQADRNEEPSEVSNDNREQQMLGFADLNNAFRAHLTKHDLQVISNPGTGSNCAIYALVQHLRPDLKDSNLDNEVNELRREYDVKNPSDSNGRMLHLDTGVGGAAKTLTRLVNERYNVNIQVGVVEAGLDAQYPVTSKETISASGASAPFTHHVVIWDQQGHYEAVTARRPRMEETAQSNRTDV
ncbi:hypothetical protein QF000_008056 [Paraburkholderia atlantica]|uniref:hypothetical protein n=1 Tax=Paraburkholderia atlantica TaxID=2654982 RepID=UPI003D1CF25A